MKLKNRIEIYNPGAFPSGPTPEIFIEGKSRPIRRNPLIARTFYYSKDMESFATGLKRISAACTEAGCKVEFEQQAYGFVVVFYRNEKNNIGKNIYVNTYEDTYVDKKRTLLIFCKEPRSKKEIADYLGYKTVKSVNVMIKELLEGKELVMTIPEKPKSTKQKYVTASKMN